MIEVADFRHDDGLRIRKDNLSPILTASRHSESEISMMPPIVSCVYLAHAEKDRWGKRIVPEMGTLGTSNDIGIMKENSIRRLTPVECERLQGFPDGWTSGLSDTQRYKCLGNAVTVNVIQAIISKWMVNQYE